MVPAGLGFSGGNMFRTASLNDVCRGICAVLLVLCTTGGAALAETKSLKMVVTAAFVSNAGLDVYDDIAGYLSKTTGYDIQVVSGLSYDQADEALARGAVEIGAICGLPYIHKAEDDQVELLAIPVMATTAGTWADVPGYDKVPGKYYSYTIVKKDSAIKDWSELRGKTYAFNDIGSNSGYNMPRYKLVQLGAKSWTEYFSKVRVSGSHEESIRMVAEGLVDASSVDSLVLDFDRANDDPYASNVRVIEVLFDGGAGAPPFVISKKVDMSFKQSLQDAMTSMHRDPEGRQILKRALLREFMLPNDANYNDVRSFEDAARRVGFQDFNLAH
jgi:phosphonate transport system substrate-binding protein